MKSWFLNRGYPKWLIDRELEKVKFPCTSGKRDTKMKRMTLVITYHSLTLYWPMFPSYRNQSVDLQLIQSAGFYMMGTLSNKGLLKDFASVIRKHLYILYLYKEVKEIFTPGPMVSFRGARKSGNFLVRAQLYPLERSVGSFKCNDKRREACLNVTETKKVLSTVTTKEYKINHKFNCNDKCFIYLFSCNKYMLQYTGKTVDEFWLRWDNYKMNDKNFVKGQTCMQ